MGERLRWDLLKRFGSFLRGSWLWLSFIFGVTAVTGSLAALFPHIFRLLEAGFTRHAPGLLVEGVVWFAGLQVAQAVLGYLRQLVQPRVDLAIQKRVLLAFYQHIHRLPIAFLDSLQGKGEIYQRIGDLIGLQYTVTGILLAGANNVLLVVVYTTILACLNPVLPLLILACFVGHLVTMRAWNRAIQHQTRQQVEAETARTNYLFDALNGLLTIRALAAGPQVHAETARLTDRVNDTQWGLTKLHARLGFLSGTFSQMATLVILLYVGYHVYRGSQSVASLLATYSIVGSLVGPLQMLAGASQRLQSANVTLTRTFEILDHPTEVPAGRPVRALPWVTGQIECQQVRFSYQPGQPVLKGISVTIPGGETVAVVGKSGAGKTTLMKLLLGFYQPDAGRILIDGIDLQEVDPASWREQVGVVLQFDILFKGSVRDNLTFGLSQPVSDVALIQALQDAHLWEFVASLPQGMDTKLDNEKLSGGQRQRLVLARAFVRNPRILIFDEPVSSLDTATEALVQDSLRRLTKGKTTIIIAHRHSTIRHADRILVMDEGQLVEQGTHDELMTRRGFYHALYEDYSWL